LTWLPFITGQFIVVLMYLAGSLAKALGQLAQQKYSFSPFTVSEAVLSVTVTLCPLTGQTASLSSARMPPTPRVSRAAPTANEATWNSFTSNPPLTLGHGRTG